MRLVHLLLLGCAAGYNPPVRLGRAGPSRRQFIGAAAAATAAVPQLSVAAAAPTTSEVGRVLPDPSARLSPRLAAAAEATVLADLASPNVRSVFLGEHHDAAADHLLQARIVHDLRARVPAERPMAVGFEAVQRKFQPVLDMYARGEITEADLERQTEWGKRWFWKFENYAPLFRECKSTGVTMLALNVDGEDLAKVEQGGYEALGGDALGTYVRDGAAFGRFAQTTAFKEYTAAVITPSYAMHKQMGILQQTVTGQALEKEMTLGRFLAGRLLWDEGMAGAGARWLKANPSGLLCSCIGSDHVKYGAGVPARSAQALQALGIAPNGPAAVRTVLINPQVRACCCGVVAAVVVAAARPQPSNPPGIRHLLQGGPRRPSHVAAALCGNSGRQGRAGHRSTPGGQAGGVRELPGGDGQERGLGALRLRLVRPQRRRRRRHDAEHCPVAGR